MAVFNQRKILMTLSALLLVLIFFNYLGWLTFLKAPFYSLLVKPLAAHGAGVKTYDYLRFLFGRDKLLVRYDECLEENQHNSVARARAQLFSDENAELKKLVAFKARQAFATVTTEVIGGNIDNTEKTIVISQGANVGIKLQQPVIAGDGILIGKIMKVEENVAFVRLISDNQQKVAAAVLGSDRSLGVVEGGYGISIRLNFIPRNETVMVGDQVVTSGLEESVPRGLLIGTVAAVENEAYQPFQQAILTPAVDLSKLIIVTVLLTN